MANFRRHMKNMHESIELIESAQCLVCNKYKSGRGAGVHLRTHNMDTIAKFPHSPTPVMTYTQKDYMPSPNRSSSQRSSAIPNSVAEEELSNDTPIQNRGAAVYTKPQTKFTQLEALVILNDCTDVDSTKDNPRPNITPVPMTSLIDDTNEDEACDDFFSTTQESSSPMRSNSLNSTLNPSAPSFTVHNNTKPYMVEMVDLYPNCDDDDNDELKHSSPSSASLPYTPYLDNNDLNNTVQSNHNTNLSWDSDPPLPSDIPFDPSYNNDNNSEFINLWSSRIKSTDSFEAFSFQCETFAEAVVDEAKNKPSNISRAKPKSNRPNRKEVNNIRPRVLPNPIVARRIQTLYRLSKKRAARQILNDNNTVYSGMKEQAKDYFTNTFANNHINIDEVLQSLNRHVPMANEDPTVMEPMSEKCIKSKLKNMSNSAPGKDRVEYHHLRQVDPDCKVLVCIFNKCLAQKQIPSVWKESTTILIYKKGNSDDASNFRPIVLMSCLYKLFTAILASRATNFAINNNLLSHQQKSARPAEGCHEHTFTLQSIIADCKMNTKDCHIAWLDLRNAFGSINHDAIYTTLSHMGFSNSFVDLIKDIYTNATTVVRTSRHDEIPPINVNAGVKQGCPISPVLFNLTSELLIRCVILKCEENPNIPFKLQKQPISILSYADDLVIISRTKEGLQDLLSEISVAADVLNLSFRQDKCATLSLTCPATINHKFRIFSSLSKIMKFYI